MEATIWLAQRPLTRRLSKAMVWEQGARSIDCSRERRLLNSQPASRSPSHDIDVANDLMLLACSDQGASNRGMVKRMAASTCAPALVFEKAMKLTPSHKLYGFGAILLVAMTIASRNFSRMGEPAFIIPLSVAGVAYLLAIRELLSEQKLPKRVVVVGLALAALWHFQFLRMPSGLDDDVHRYVWDGRVQRLGYNPYVLVPRDPALSGLHTTETRTLNNPEVPSPYPPGAQLFFRAVTAIHESTFALKVAFVICDLAIVFVLLDVLRRTGQGEHWVLAYAWHPLLATEVAGSGHVDIVGVLLLLVSAAALVRSWRAVAAIAFGLAIAVKLLPLVLLPLYWKRLRVRDGTLAAIVLGLLYVPFLDHSRIPFGSLGTYVQRFRFNDPVFATLERVMAPQVVAGLAVLVGFLTAIWMRRRYAEWSSDTFAWPMAASLLCAPVIYPWYMLWLLPFLRSTSNLPIMVWTLSIIPTYHVWRLRTLGQPWVVPGWIMLLEYGSVAAAAAIIALLRGGRSGTRPCSTDQVGQSPSQIT
jgi:alpha-1,6-mannosyltransferase